MTGFTGIIKHNNDFQNISTLTGVTFTQGKTYNIQVQEQAWIKLSDAKFFVENEKFDFTAGTTPLQIKTPSESCILTIHEAETGA